ncbi:MAG: VRR-NUC domain-containing protein [Gammaproteobacteria bacterium]|nr:VRR-NUC domain-containing protein [Gammaproteobacteria bacterium]
MQPDLPDSYYLDNVTTLFTHVEDVYLDILDVDYIQFLRRFSALPDDSKKLYIRLLNRNREWFRVSKLDYPEITSISQAVKTLQQSNFLQVNPEPDIESIINLFTKADILKIHPEKKKLQKLSRQQLDEYVLENINDEFCQQLFLTDSFLNVLHKDIYVLFQMLFFGNLNQSMTDFVLRDLGLYQYESYPVDAENRPYNSREEIQQHWLLQQLETLLDSSDWNDHELLLECYSSVPENIHQHSFLFRKSERIKYKIARQVERQGNLDLALSLYLQCQLPPSRERCIRIHQQQGDFELAVSKCQQIIHSPYDDSESQFAIEFSTRLIKRYRLPLPCGLKLSENYQPEIIELQLDQQQSVEQAVVDHYCSSNKNQDCFYLENSLFNGVLGLLIWDVIFTPVSGAFYNPFQYRPSDFYAFDFVNKRQHLFDEIWNSLENNNDIWNIVLKCWTDKKDLMNPMINWNTLNLDIIQLALQRIEYQHWLNIFKRILADLRNNRSGFPDLILFPPEGGYKLLEVKGPGDRLQKNQLRWMSFFSVYNIPHEVVRVSWKAKMDKGT